MDIKFHQGIGPSIDLHLRGRVNVVCGAIGSGKSYVYKLLEELSAPMLEGNDDLLKANGMPKMLFLNALSSEGQINELYSTKERLVVIDNADYLLKKNSTLSDFINEDYYNTYIVYMRQNEYLQVTPNYYAQMKYVNDKIILDYYYSLKGWF
jgi:hypothetical protein